MLCQQVVGPAKIYHRNRLQAQILFLFVLHSLCRSDNSRFLVSYYKGFVNFVHNCFGYPRTRSSRPAVSTSDGSSSSLLYSEPLAMAKKVDIVKSMSTVRVVILATLQSTRTRACVLCDIRNIQRYISCSTNMEK